MKQELVGRQAELAKLGLEPLSFGVKESIYRQAYEAEALRSIAISLKRIADTLDGTSAGLDITDTIFGVGRER